MKYKNILLTGATGLVGSELIKCFSLAHLNIKALSRNAQQPIKNVEWIVSDLENPELDLCKMLENVDVIIHNAASLKSGKTQNEINEIDKVNIQFTKRLLASAVNTNIKKVIFTSGMNIIKKPLPNLITEESKLNPITSYAKSKYIGEQLIQEFAAKYGKKYSILRLSSPVNFNLDLMPQTVLKKWILQSKNNEKIYVYGKGIRSQDYVSVIDVSEVFLECIENNVCDGIFNIASGSTISMLELAQIICQKFGSKYELLNKDENENDQWNISNEKAKRILNFKPKFTSKDVIFELLNSN